MTSEDQKRDPQTDEEPSTEPVADLLPAYALGALDDEERVRIEVELARSPTLRDEAQRLQSTVDTLDLTVPRAIPDAALRTRVLESVGHASKPVSLDDRRSSTTRRLLAAAAVLVLVLGSAIAFLAIELQDRAEQISDLEAAAANRAGTDFTQPLVWTEISAENTASDGWGYFCRTTDGSVGWIVVEGMPTANDQVYQLWLVDDDGFVSAGLFTTDDEGRGFGVVRADEPVHSFRQIWITIEPPGGSPAPTSDPDVSVPIV